MQLKLDISCKDIIKNEDLFKGRSPMICLYEQTHLGAFKLTDKTEVIFKELNPVFKEPFIIDYNFTQDKLIKLVVYDIDTPDEIENLKL